MNVRFFNKLKIGYIYLLCTVNLFSQNQKRADSLKFVYGSGEYNLTEFRILSRISESETIPDSSLYYANRILSIAPNTYPKDSSLLAFHLGYLSKGNAFQRKGKNLEAIESFLNSLEYAEKMGHESSMAYLQISIADTYAMMENNSNAELYYSKGIELMRKGDTHKEKRDLASALLNKGDWLFSLGRYDESLSYFKESDSICDQIDFQLGKAYNLGNIGLVYAEQNKHDLAEKNINKAIVILEDLEDYYPVSVYLTYLADIYVSKANIDEAFKYAEKSLNLAKGYGLKEQIRDANLKLSELHENAANHEQSLDYYKNFVVYRDSIRNIEAVQGIANEITERQQAENELLLQKRKTQRIILFATLGVLILIGLLAYGLFRRNKFVQATNKIIAAEKERSDHLLLNILPEDTAEELKEKGRVAAKKYDDVTVLFSDFKGFTSYAENLSPEELVQTVDYYFTHFDSIIDKYGLEKIKTIGDAYMAAGGLSFDNVDKAKEMVLAAKEMKDFVTQAKTDTHTSATFDIRIGINTGPVVAGVVGTKKFAYDIWGDTVNIAARMESNSESGRINVSEDTYNIIKSDFDCEYRGELEVKNRGIMKMYFVNC
ncbi:class 3 adenylate cyclase [Winogradskyella wandonensis]|uniref:Class 3 adenylate cyclase n=1 Tax=Winogradskyella wandonensis TaxID=1442586 RepID=A0A4R1KVV7_9FLAO|nr:adenylate/guanylate cyclase domain-containing protein [Winogradskyella wandonensis]TCK69315.1 class 3 adenylate cyclase [Winogradskyella wandonensis]